MLAVLVITVLAINFIPRNKTPAPRLTLPPLFVTDTFVIRQYAQNPNNNYMYYIEPDAITLLNDVAEDKLVKMKCTMPYYYESFERTPAYSIRANKGYVDLEDTKLLDLINKAKKTLVPDNEYHTEKVSSFQTCDTEDGNKFIAYQAYSFKESHMMYFATIDNNAIQSLNKINSEYLMCFVIQLTKTNDLHVYCSPTYPNSKDDYIIIYNLNLDSGNTKLLYQCPAEANYNNNSYIISNCTAPWSSKNLLPAPTEKFYNRLVPI